MQSSTAFFDPKLQSLIHEAIQNTPDGIGIFDPEDRLVFANAAMADVFSMSADHAIGLKFEDLIRHLYKVGNGLNLETDDIEQWLLDALKKRRSSLFRSFQTDTSDGRWLQLTEQLTDDGHMFVYFTDITEQKRIEAKLQKLSSKLKVQAETDELTGLHNRRNFFYLAEKELRRCQRLQQGVALLLLDVDFFKQINDSYGHQQGDYVLRHICDELQQELREYDVLGRIGGEEFALLVPQVQSERAFMIAERLREIVAAIVFDAPLAEVRMSISVGVASCSTADEPINSLIGRADKALFEAKHSGRNRCKAAD